MTITWEQVLAFLCEDQTMAITSLLFPRLLRQWRSSTMPCPLLLVAPTFCWPPATASSSAMTRQPPAGLGDRRRHGADLAVRPHHRQGQGSPPCECWHWLRRWVRHRHSCLLQILEPALWRTRWAAASSPPGESAGPLVRRLMFAAMSYTIDVYAPPLRVETNLLHYARCLSASSPPSSTGPLSAIPRCARQIRKEPPVSAMARCAGGVRYAVGLHQKMVIADN